jgi:hypothetical protein
MYAEKNSPLHLFSRKWPRKFKSLVKIYKASLVKFLQRRA